MLGNRTLVVICRIIIKYANVVFKQHNTTACSVNKTKGRRNVLLVSFLVPYDFHCFPRVDIQIFFSLKHNLHLLT